MRQLRDLRQALNLSKEQASERFYRIENSCMRLWEFLVDLEQYQGTDLSEATLSGSVTPSSAQPPLIVNDFPNQTAVATAAPTTQPRRIKVGQKAGSAGSDMAGKTPRSNLFGRH